MLKKENYIDPDNSYKLQKDIQVCYELNRKDTGIFTYEFNYKGYAKCMLKLGWIINIVEEPKEGDK